jgi:regulatory protein
MKITKLEQQKKNHNRYNLFIDGEFKIGIHEDVIVALHLYEKKEISQEDYNDILIKEQYAKAKQSALTYATYKLRSRHEVIKKLNSLEVESTIIDKVMEFLEEYNFVNDKEYIKAFINDKTNINKHSLKRIKYDLKSKGLNMTLVDEVLEDYSLVDLELENVTTLYQKKYNQIEARNKYTDYEIEQKTMQYLMNKGYNYSIVKKVKSIHKEERNG